MSYIQFHSNDFIKLLPYAIYMSGVSTAVRHNGQILLKESQASIQSAQKA